MALSKIDAANFLTGTIPQGNVANASLGAVTALPAAITTGKVLQVVTTATTTGASTTSSSFVETDLWVNITPTSSSSKIFISASTPMHGTSGGWDFWSTIYRDGTNLGSSTGLATCFGGSSTEANNASMIYLDSPNTTSQITYKVYHRTNSGNGTNYINWSGGTGVITAMEISA